MKKIVSLLLICTMCTAILMGCGSKDSGTNKNKENSGGAISTDELGNDENANYDVEGTITVGINSYRNSDVEALLNTFKSLYPNVTVNPILFESSSDDATEYLTAQMMAEKELPNIMFDDAGSIPTYIQNGWIHPLTEFVQGDSDFENVPKNIVENFTYNGNLYALGQTIQSNMLIVNTDIVEEMNVDLPELDWTWEEFTEFIKLCTNNQYSGVDDLSDQYNWASGAMTEGRSIVGYDYETNTFDLTAVQKYVNYYAEISKLGGVEATSLKQNAASGTSDFAKKFGDIGNGTDAAFIAGKVASTFTGTWKYADWNAKELEFNWDMYPIPQVSEGRVPIHVDYCWMSTSVTDANREAAWEFLRFVTYSREGNIARLTTYDEDHITSDMNFAYYIPCTLDETVVEKFESLPYVTDAVLYIFENLDNGYLGDPEKTVPGFEAVEYPIIGELAFESITGRDDFSSKMMDAQTKANAEIANYKKVFDEALAKFEQEFFK